MAKRRVRGGSRAERARERLLARLPDLGKVLRGTVVQRYRRCGRADCHCAQPGERGHGPAYYLMVTVGRGQTVQIYVPREHKREAEAWVRNFQRARETLEEISAVNRKLLKEGELFGPRE